jgi:hypothetical protein
MTRYLLAVDFIDGPFQEFKEWLAVYQIPARRRAIIR